MKLCVVGVVLGGVARAALSDKAHFILNNPEFNNLTKDVQLSMVKLSILPTKLVALLRSALDDGYDKKYLAHMVFQYAETDILEMVHDCVELNGDLKGIQGCVMEKSGMNPYLVRLFKCMGNHRDWHELTPLILEDARWSSDRDEYAEWRLSILLEGIKSKSTATKISCGMCLDNLRQHSVQNALAKFVPGSDDAIKLESKEESDILTTLLLNSDILAQVPMPLEPTNLESPSQLIPMILRHFTTCPSYQAVLDRMESDWSTFPIRLLEKTLRNIRKNILELDLDEYAPGVKHLEYNKLGRGHKVVWWKVLFEDMMQDDNLSESFAAAIARWGGLPIEGPESELGFLKTMDRSVYGPYLTDLLVKFNIIAAYRAKALPKNPLFIDKFLLSLTLTDGEFKDPVDCALLLLHPSLGANDDFDKKLYSLIEENDLDFPEMTRKLWSPNDIPMGAITLASDLQAVFNLPFSPKVDGTYDEVKQSIYGGLLQEIFKIGGDNYGNLKSFVPFHIPQWLSITQSILTYLRDGKVEMANWLAADFPLFGKEIFPEELPKNIVGLLFYYGIQGAPRGKEHCGLRSIFTNGFIEIILREEEHSEQAIRNLSEEKVKELNILAHSDTQTFTNALVRIPGIIANDEWHAYAMIIVEKKSLKLTKKQLASLYNYDAMLRFLHDGGKIFSN